MANQNQPNRDQGNDKTNHTGNPNNPAGAKQQEQQAPRDQKDQQGGALGEGQQNRDQPRENNQR